MTPLLSVFEEFERLRENTPRIGLMAFQNKNSVFCNYTFSCKNASYSVGCDYLENSHYQYWGYSNTDCVDCSYCTDCLSCYECLDCQQCSNSFYLQECAETHDSSYCFDCVSVRNCFACIGLFRKEFHIFNKPYAPDEYFKKVEKLRQKPANELRKLFREVKAYRPHVYMRQSRNDEKCTGDYVSLSKNSQFCFDVTRAKDSLYMTNAINCSECVDISFAGEPPLLGCYEIMSGMGLDECRFCNACWHDKFLEYCELCFHCEYCFLCVGLQNRKFYILNQAYEPPRYFAKVQELKERMKKEGSYGKWFPSAYPLEDSKACEDFMRVDFELEKRMEGLRENIPVPRRESRQLI